MDEFSYLSVLLSIIIGLAVTQILQGFRGRMLSHVQSRRYWPTEVWAGTLLLVCTQTWWAMFDLRNRHVWEFNEFAVLLAQSIVLYLVCGLVYPDFRSDEVVDLRAHYFAQRKRFFGLVTATAVISICRDLVLSDALPGRANLGFHVGYLALSTSAIVVEREWYHKALALLFAALIVCYVAVLFTRLA
jgi:hypothetical protein